MPTGRPAGRPPRDQPALVRAHLLGAAARSFAVNGYAATSVRALARALGVSQSAVQHHARTKDALLRAVVDEVVLPALDAASAQARSIAAGGPGPASATAVRRLVRQRLSALTAHGGVVLAVLEDRSPGCGDRQAFLLERLLPARGDGLGALGGLAARGLTRPLSATTWTALVLLAVPAVARSWSALAPLPDAPGDLEEVLDELAAVLLDGLLVRT